MALRQINMIPANILERTHLASHLWFWGKGLLFIFLVLTMFYIAQANTFSRQQKAKHSDASMKIKVASKIDQSQREANEINVLMKDLALKSGVLANLTNQQLYYDILAVFARAFNDSTWIDQLSIQRGNQKDKDISSLMVDGFSLTHNTLGLFLESLSGNNRIQDVVLVNAKKQELISPDKDFPFVIKFKLTCAIIQRSSK